MFRTPSFWQNINIIAIILLPFSYIYIFLTFIRKLFATRYESTSSKVICVGGNIAGGSGKTSIVIFIAKLLKEKTNKKFCIVTYGPGGNIRGPVLVDKTTTIEEAGDEAWILSQLAPTIIAKQKHKAIKLAQDMEFDYIIVDDGLQNPNFKKDLSICCVNSNIKNNGLIFPAGPNRESISDAIKKSDIIIYFGEKNFDSQNKIIINSKKIFSPSFSQNKITAFCSIANPDLFQAALIENGADIIRFTEYPDHHNYTTKDLDSIFNNNSDAKLVTTLKDYVKLPVEYQKQVIVFEESIYLENPGILLDEILKKKT